jgi:hypothetical protein
MYFFEYQKQCLLGAVVPSIIMGGAFTAIDTVTHSIPSHSILPTAKIYVGGIFCYHAMICPMEAIHGRQSAWHNILSGGTLGYIGVKTGRLGVPFLDDSYFFYKNPQVSRAMAGAAVYGAIGGALSVFLGGKPL